MKRGLKSSAAVAAVEIVVAGAAVAAGTAIRSFSVCGIS